MDFKKFSEEFNCNKEFFEEVSEMVPNQEIVLYAIDINLAASFKKIGAPDKVTNAAVAVAMESLKSIYLSFSAAKLANKFTA